MKPNIKRKEERNKKKKSVNRGISGWRSLGSPLTFFRNPGRQETKESSDVSLPPFRLIVCGPLSFPRVMAVDRADTTCKAEAEISGIAGAIEIMEPGRGFSPIMLVLAMAFVVPDSPL